MEGIGTSMLPPDIRISVEKKAAALSLNAKGEVQGTFLTKRALLAPTPVYNVLWVEANGGNFELSYLDRRHKGKSKLSRVHGRVQEADRAAVEEWCRAVMAAAYADIKPRRKLRVLVNPRGGPGKAVQTYEKVVEPIFTAARCIYETTCTESSKHATDIAKSVSLDNGFDAYVLLSGDGLIHEVINGFAQHEDPIRAFSTPIVPIPTGSGNGTSLNLLGLEEGFDVGVASLNAIKGKPMKIDICSMTSGGKRTFTYMTQALGLMADLDLGTEHLRWMGDTRFMVGYLRGVYSMKSCPLTLSIKVAETDKDSMAEQFKTKATQENPSDFVIEVGEDLLPLLKHTEEATAENGWITFEKPLVTVVAGKSPFVGRDLMQFPVAEASDGLIDIVAQELSTRVELLKCIDGGPKGSPFWLDTQHYFKAYAYRVTPHTSHGNLSIDGERYPLEPFAIEVHRGLGTFLSPYGRYVHTFDVPRPAGTGLKAKPDDGMEQMGMESGSDEGSPGAVVVKKVVACCLP